MRGWGDDSARNDAFGATVGVVAEQLFPVGADEFEVFAVLVLGGRQGGKVRVAVAVPCGFFAFEVLPDHGAEFGRECLVRLHVTEADEIQILGREPGRDEAAPKPLLAGEAHEAEGRCQLFVAIENAFPALGMFVFGQIKEWLRLRGGVEDEALANFFVRGRVDARWQVAD